MAQRLRLILEDRLDRQLRCYAASRHESLDRVATELLGLGLKVALARDHHAPSARREGNVLPFSLGDES